jgi:hypothetical protein
VRRFSWGETGGTSRDKDEEIRVRTGNLRIVAVPRLSAPKRRVFYGVVEYEGLVLAPWSGLELTTLRLIAYAPEWRVFFRSESKQESSWVSHGAWISVLAATVSQQGLAPRNEI